MNPQTIDPERIPQLIDHTRNIRDGMKRTCLEIKQQLGDILKELKEMGPSPAGADAEQFNARLSQLTQQIAELKEKQVRVGAYIACADYFLECLEGKRQPKGDTE